MIVRLVWVGWCHMMTPLILEKSLYLTPTPGRVVIDRRFLLDVVAC